MWYMQLVRIRNLNIFKNYLLWGHISENEERGHQQILKFELLRGVLQWKTMGLTKFKTFGTGVSPIAYNNIKGQDQCPTYLNEERRSSELGKHLCLSKHLLHH